MAEVPVALGRSPDQSGPVVHHSLLGPEISAWHIDPDADFAPFVRGRQAPNALKLSCDRKVSPKGWLQTSRDRWVPKVPNSFGLPAGVSCPGKTEFCNGCYADISEQGSGVSDLVNHNLRLLQAAGTVIAMAKLLRAMIGTFLREAGRLHVPPEELIFRGHWDGDFFSIDYAKAWAIVIQENPRVKFWFYTRSFREPVNVVPVLAGIPNLTLYLSVDEWNSADAWKVVEQYPDVLLAGCAVDYKSARELVAGRRSLVCPENRGSMRLMEDDGNGNGVGACVRCMLCPDGKADVLFSTAHVEDVEGGQGVLADMPKRQRKPRKAKAAPARDDFNRQEMLEQVRRWPTIWDLQSARKDGEDCASVVAFEREFGSVPAARKAARELNDA